MFRPIVETCKIAFIFAGIAAALWAFQRDIGALDLLLPAKPAQPTVAFGYVSP